MTQQPIAVLLVDDSATVRAVLRRLLTADPAIRIVGEAVDGQQAVELARRLEPDLIVMDLELPGMDGLAATREIRRHRPVAVVVVTATARRELVDGAFEAMDQGVVGVFAKPDVPEMWHELSGALRELARRVSGRQPTLAVASPAAIDTVATRVVRVIAIGASTGGPAAVRAVLAGIARPVRAGIAIVQHIADGFEGGFADWLRHETGLDVRVAADHDLLEPGCVRVAPYGAHLVLGAGDRLQLDHDTPAVRGHRPSADILFHSVAATAGAAAAGVLLTGMGTDGADGLLHLRHSGALTIAQTEATCTVFGMPRAARDRGAAELMLDPEEIGRVLARMLADQQP